MRTNQGPLRREARWHLVSFQACVAYLSCDPAFSWEPSSQSLEPTALSCCCLNTLLSLSAKLQHHPSRAPCLYVDRGLNWEVEPQSNFSNPSCVHIHRKRGRAHRHTSTNSQSTKLQTHQGSRRPLAELRRGVLRGLRLSWHPLCCAFTVRSHPPSPLQGDTDKPMYETTRPTTDQPRDLPLSRAPGGVRTTPAPRLTGGRPTYKIKWGRVLRGCRPPRIPRLRSRFFRGGICGNCHAFKR